MNKHILLEKAHVYPLPKQQPDMTNYSYNDNDGYWTIKTSNQPYILDENGPRPQTKKHDIETGEDQKGE